MLQGVFGLLYLMFGGYRLVGGLQWTSAGILIVIGLIFVITAFGVFRGRLAPIVLSACLSLIILIRYSPDIVLQLVAYLKGDSAFLDTPALLLVIAIEAVLTVVPAAMLLVFHLACIVRMWKRPRPNS